MNQSITPQNQQQAITSFQQTAPVVSIGEWIAVALIMMIPIINIIMMFVWAFGGSTNPSKANYFKAQLLIFAILIIVCIVIALVAIMAGSSLR